MSTRYVHIAAMCTFFAVLSTGCSYLPKQVVEVPVRVSCVAAVPAKPSRLTPCPPVITNSQCVKRAAIDIERLDSALDQSNELLKACI